MLNDIHQHFEEIKTYGLEVRKSKIENNKLDENVWWSLIESVIESTVHTQYRWKPINYRIRKLILDLPNIDDDGSRIEFNYYIKQCVIIPEISELSDKVLSFIAYNIGLLTAIINDNSDIEHTKYKHINEKIYDEFVSANMHMCSAYIRPVDPDTIML